MRSVSKKIKMIIRPILHKFVPNNQSSVRLQCVFCAYCTIFVIYFNFIMTLFSCFITQIQSYNRNIRINENKILRYTVINLSISKLLVGNYLLPTINYLPTIYYLLPTINYVLCITIVEDDILLPIAILSNKGAPSVRPPPEI